MQIQGTDTQALAEHTCLIVPLYNEGTVIKRVVEHARQTFPHVICVDDGSSDNSAQAAHQAGATVIKHPINLGQGAALQTGITWAITQTTHKYLVTFDADGQHRTSDALDMVKRAEHENLGFVIGSRFLKGPAQAGTLKKIVLKTAALAASKRTGMKLSDAHNGIRVIRRDCAEKIQIRQNRMAHASEIVKQLAATHLPWAEHPVTIDYTDYSRAKGQSLINGINIVTDMLLG